MRALALAAGRNEGGLFSFFLKILKAILQTRVPKISASVDGWPSGGSRVRRPGSEDPHRR